MMEKASSVGMVVNKKKCAIQLIQMFSKYMARFFKIYGPPGTAFRTGFTTCGVDMKASTTTTTTSRRGSRHGFRGVSMAIRPDMPGYDRRHKSVGGPSRCVWGPRRRCFEGRRGVKTHRFNFESRDDWQCRNRHIKRFHGLFKIKCSCSSGKSNILTVASARGIF